VPAAVSFTACQIEDPPRNPRGTRCAIQFRVQPHDRLFRGVFSYPEHARALLRSVLPEALAARFDFSTLLDRSAVFVPPQFIELRGDLVFSVSLDGAPAYVYVLLEHQSTVDPLMPFRVLAYMVEIWRSALADDGGKSGLPPIIPVVLHHSETGWTGATRFHDIVAVQPDLLAVLAPLLPQFEFLLEDVSHDSDEVLRLRALTDLGRATLVCLARLRGAENVLEVLAQFADIFAAAANRSSPADAFGYVMNYILLATETPYEDIQPFFRDLGPAAEEAFMTTAQQLIEQGMLKGRAEGRAAGKAELLGRQLRLKFGKLPEWVSAQLSQATPEELDLFAERLLTATTLDEVFA
jgi:predicted transposase/invertase (TIGR01784 family)